MTARAISSVFNAPRRAIERVIGGRSFLQRTVGALGGARKTRIESEELGSSLGLLSVFFIMGIDARALADFLEKAPAWFSIGFLQLWGIVCGALGVARLLVIWIGSRRARARMAFLMSGWWMTSFAVFMQAAGWRVAAALSLGLFWKSASTYWSIQAQLYDENGKERPSVREPLE